jgi:hypothetical protein
MNSNEPLSCRDLLAKIDQEIEQEEEERLNKELVLFMLAKEKYVEKKRLEKKKPCPKKVEKKSVWNKLISVVFPTPKWLESRY